MEGLRIEQKTAIRKKRRTYFWGKDQLSLFNEAEEAQDHKAEEPNTDTILVPAHERKKKHSQAEMLNHLPEVQVLLEIPEDQLVCGKCGGKMKPIGKKFLRHEMQIIPKRVKLLAYYTVAYACDHCEKDTLGRKNWLFCDTPKGAEASAIVYSLVESAKANGVKPFAYLQHVLVQLPYLVRTPLSKITSTG